MVESTIRVIDPNVPITLVHASRGKVARAEPISALYEQGRVHHMGMLPELEDQLCSFEPGSTKSPDRLDSVVWALTDLMITNQVKGMVAWEMARQEAMTPKDAPEPISPEFAIGSAGWAAQQAEPARTAGDAESPGSWTTCGAAFKPGDARSKLSAREQLNSENQQMLATVLGLLAAERRHLARPRRAEREYFPKLPPGTCFISNAMLTVAKGYAMDWHVQYRKDGTQQVVRHPTPEEAIDDACKLIDNGYDVFGIGTGPLTDSIAKDEIAEIYDIWVRAKYSIGEI